MTNNINKFKFLRKYNLQHFQIRVVLNAQ